MAVAWVLRRVNPLDIVESDRWGEPLHGLKPALPLRGHARRAVERVLGWLREQANGEIIRTRTGDPRVMPYSLRLLARQYIYDHLDRPAFPTDGDWMYARRYYTYALEVELGNMLESWAEASRDDASDEFRKLVGILGLDDL